MDQEKSYMLTALERTGCVVMVCSYELLPQEKKQKLIYLSPNAQTLGMKKESLTRGFRLPMDYVYPEDRQDFRDALDMVFRNLDTFSYQLRIAGEDQELRVVDVDVVPSAVSDTEIQVEYILREKRTQEETPTENTEVEIDLDGDGTSDLVISSHFFEQSGIGEIAKEFASVCGVYSVIVDSNRNPLVKPTGPKSHFGEFYQMTVNPRYDDEFEKIRKYLRDHQEAYYSEVTDDGNRDSRISAAPIYVGGVYFATWILYAYTELQAQNLYKACQRQYRMTEGFSRLITLLYQRNSATDDQEQIRRSLDFEIQQKKIVLNLMNRARNSSVQEFCRGFEDAGKLLNLDYIVYYAPVAGDENHMDLVYFWTRNGDRKAAEEAFSWEQDHYPEEQRARILEEGLVVDRRNMTNQMRVEVFRGKARAVIVLPVWVRKKYKGRLIFIENSKEREWSESEVEFTKEIANLFGRALLQEELGARKEDDSSEKVREVLSAFHECVFVRRRKTGEIIFSNEAFKDMLGYDPTGKDSWRMIPHIQDEFEGLREKIRESVIPEKKEPVHFRRYIDAFGGIFDVTEVGIEWNQIPDADLMILEPVGE